MSTPKEYVRVRMQGRITTLSPLHVGSGSVRSFSARLAAMRRQLPPNHGLVLAAMDPQKDDDAEDSYAAVYCDAHGRPCIPASTLRGALRAAAPAEARERLFGPEHIDEQTGGRSGCVRLSDARLERSSPIAAATAQQIPYFDADRSTGIQHGIAIDPITGAVREHMLYRLEFVPAAAEFTFSALLLDASEQDLRHFAQAVRQLDQRSLGKGVAQGYGRIGVSDPCWEALDATRLAEWAASPGAPLENHYRRLPAPVAAALPRSGRIAFQLIADGPLLIHQPGLDRAQPRGDGDAETQDVMMCDRDSQNRPRLPGTTLKGWARARARRILHTLYARIHAARNSDIAHTSSAIDKAIALLFGSAGRRSIVYFSDAIAATSATHAQTFNAIDRFTGGVMPDALYRVDAVLADRFDASLGLDVDTLDDWQRGLLLWVLRDALEGDLVLGWGKGKGYGDLRLCITATGAAGIETWPDALQALQNVFGSGAPAAWAHALEKHVASMGKTTAKKG
ncbi:MAG: hypothetical protein AMXMBFR59_38530 [Rhodanobacteraceae bacterium]